jgi:uncharacterized membrane protein
VIARTARTFTCVALIALIFLCLLWEARLAPIKPGGSLLMLKALPLLLPLFGLLRGKRYTYQWTPLLVLAYLCEGIVRAWSEHHLARALALSEVLLCLIVIVSAAAYARLSRSPMPSSPLP